MRIVDRAIMAIALYLLATSAPFACAPAPSCWLKYDRQYIKSVCIGYAKQTTKQIAQSLDNPEEIGTFVKACAKLGIKFKQEAER